MCSIGKQAGERRKRDQVAKSEGAEKVEGEPGWLVELEQPAAYGFVQGR